MVAKKRITKKDLKKPDEFVTWGSRAMDYVTARKTYIGLGALVLALVVLAVFFYHEQPFQAKTNTHPCICDAPGLI